MAVARRWLARITLALAAGLVFWVFALILYGVGARYLLGASPIWFDELARYSIIAAAMIGVGAVWIEGAHMRVGILETRVPPAFRRALVVYQWLLTLALSAAMTWISWGYVQQVSFFTTQGLGISRSYPVAVLPVGFALLFVMAALKGPVRLAQPHEAEP